MRLFELSEGISLSVTGKLCWVGSGDVSGKEAMRELGCSLRGWGLILLLVVCCLFLLFFFGLMCGYVCECVPWASAREFSSLFSGYRIHYLDRLDLPYSVV